MNLMAGFLYLSLNKDEALAFGVLKRIIDRQGIEKMFDKEKPTL